MEDKKQNLIDYLLVNEAREEREELNRLIDLAKDLYQGRHLAIANPFERETALLFEMIMQNGFDPWNIDLKKFAELFLDHAMNDDLDLPSAGLVIVMAWKILRLQSEGVVRLVEGEKNEGIGWDDILAMEPMMEGYEEKNGKIEYSLEEKVRHKAERKVTLLELVDAFRHAFDEAKVYLSRRERNRKKIRRDLKLAREAISKMLCRENIEADIEQFLDRLGQFDGKEIGLKNFYNLSEKEGFIHSLLPMLFLAKEGKIDIRQANFPYGNIYLRKINGFGKTENRSGPVLSG
ncbi:MAG TPA: segregation/condensation protein A [Thermoplasmata archaeon]|nr:segregation/condensation protein A [Thermoplasmata archaeon]